MCVENKLTLQYALHPAGRSVLRTAAAAWRLDWNPMGSCLLIFPARHWPDDINPAYQELVRKNLAFHGKTEEEFAAGVERVIKAEQELFG